jgi:hypothetical protein
MIASLLTLCALCLPLAAQTPIETTGESVAEKPQIAYRLFSNWADNYMADQTRGKQAAEGIMFGLGALCIAGSATTWFAGDAISINSYGSPMNPDTKGGVTLGLGIAGGVILLSGAIVAAVPIKDYRAIYADVFNEKDPEVREAMAVSALRYQADRGKEGRMRAFFMGFAVPLIAGGITAGVNAASGERWDKNLWNTMSGSSWCIAGSIFSLFQKSPEEQLYDRYLTARKAYYDELGR